MASKTSCYHQVSGTGEKKCLSWKVECLVGSETVKKKVTWLFQLKYIIDDEKRSNRIF